MEKTLLFNFGPEESQSMIRLGEFAEFLHACYLKAKSLGFIDGNIYMIWPCKFRYDLEQYTYDESTGKNILSKLLYYYECPPDRYLPINFIKRENAGVYNFSMIINVYEDNLFFENTKSIRDRHHEPFNMYPSKYHFDTGKECGMIVPKEKHGKSVILFHYRKLSYGTNREMPESEYIQIIKDIKTRFGNKYRYELVGENSRNVNRLFDRRYPLHVNNLNNLFRIINNASVVVGLSSGVCDIANILGVPFIVLKTPRIPKTKPHPCLPEKWKGTQYEKYGHAYAWKNPDLYILFWDNEGYDMDKIYAFMEKYT